MEILMAVTNSKKTSMGLKMMEYRFVDRFRQDWKVSQIKHRESRTAKHGITANCPATASATVFQPRSAANSLLTNS